MLTVLMIDDDAEIAETIRDEVEDAINDVRFVIETDFDKTSENIEIHRPDVLILDLFREPRSEMDIAGQPIWQEVWNHRFIPIVLYTAGYDELEPPIPNHPFVRYQEKGDGTERGVIESIEGFSPTISALRAAELEIDRVFQNVLQSIAEFAFEHADGEDARAELIVRSGRRRVAAMMDEALAQGDSGVFSWERYLYPPIGDSPLMGDIIQAVGTDNKDAASYSIILSPSCDIQQDRCNVTRILVAKCGPALDYLTKGIGLESSSKEKTFRSKLPRALNDAQSGGLTLLPGFPGRFPSLSVNYRNFDLIEPNEIGVSPEDGKPYFRVVSVDSPFREQLSWGHIQIAGRPGMPAQDHAGTIDEIVANFCKNQG